MFNKILALALLVASTAAFGGSKDHSNWAKRRAQKSNSNSGAYFWANKTEATTGTLTEGSTKVDLNGTGIGAGTGIEFDGWVRLAGYGLYRNLSNGKNDTMFGPAGGVSLNLSFASPVVDLNFGIGAEASSLSRQASETTSKYTSQGGFAQLAIERFVASNISLELGVEAKRESLEPKEKKENQKSVSLDTKSFWLGATFWMY